MEGTFQFQLFQALRFLKNDLKNFAKDFQKKDNNSIDNPKKELDQCQRFMESQPLDPILRAQ